MLKKVFRNAFVFILASLLLVYFNGCSHDIQTNSKTTNTTNPVKKEKVFAIVYPILHPFFADTTMGAEETASKMGCKLIVKAPNKFDIQTQISMVEELISMSVDGIGIGPTDSDALTPVINKAVAAGIKVVCFDTDAPKSNRLSYIGTDNIKAGKHMGAVLAKNLNNEGKILVSMGVPSQLNLNQRVDGLKQYLDSSSNIKILDIKSNMGDPDIAISEIEEMINKYPDFDSLVCIDSLSGPAAVLVWKAKGFEKKLLIAFDDQPEVMQGIKDNKVTATICQKQNMWGMLIINRLNEACEGKIIPEFEDTGTIEVTNSIINTYKN